MKLFQVGQYWHYRFQVNGIRTHRTTHETDRRRAQVIADQAHEAARLRARGLEPVPRLSACVVKWIDAHQNILSTSYLRSIEVWGRLHLGDLGGLPLTAISTERVEIQRAAYAATHARASVNGWTKKLSVVMRWAQRRSMLTAIPYQVKQVHAQVKPKPVLPAGLTSTWLSAIDAQGSTAISIGTRLSLGLGLRQSEVITARWEWLDWAQKRYTPGETKGREATPLPVPDWLLETLRSHQSEKGLIVSKGGRPMPTNFLRAPMLRANRAVGAPHITPHRLRGTYATTLAEDGLSVTNLQHVMRHRDSRTTLAYVAPNENLIREAQIRQAQRMGLQPFSPSQPISAQDGQ